MAGLRIAGGTLLIIAGVGTIVLFFRPRKLRRMMRMNSRVYRESESRRELGDAVYQYTVFPRVMGVMWLGPVSPRHDTRRSWGFAVVISALEPGQS